MLIISGYRDYYDSMAYAYGIDKTLVFHREIDVTSFDLSKLSLFQKEVLSKLRSGNTRYNFRLHSQCTSKLLFFCDRIYFYSELKIDGKIYHIYDLNDERLNKELKSYGMKSVKQLMDSVDNLKSIFDIIKEPYFTIEENYAGYVARIPKLIDIEFHKVLDANECYQLIESSLTKLKGNHDDKLVEIADKCRLTQHGFDDKISFRHRV